MANEVKCSEVKWTDLKRDDKTSESGWKWKMANEVKWSERIWSVMIKRLKVNGSEKLEVKCSEVKWTDFKGEDKTSESGWK